MNASNAHNASTRNAKPNKHPLIARILKGICIAALSAPAMAMDLTTTLNLATNYDANWAAIRENYNAQKQDLDLARANLLPTLSLGAQVNRQDMDNGISGDSRNTSYGANLRQPLLRLDGWYGMKAARSEQNRYSIEFANERQNFLLRVLDTYLAVLQTQQALEVIDAQLASVTRQKEQTEKRLAVGLVARTDVYEATAAYDRVQVQRISAQSDLQVALRNLTALTGKYPKQVATLSEKLPIVLPQPNDPSAWVKRAQENNPELRAAQFKETSAKNTWKARRAQHYPTLDLVGQYQHTEGRDLTLNRDLDDNDVTTLSVELALPLYSGGAVSAQSQKSRLLWAAAQQTHVATRRSITNDTQNQLQIVQTQVAAVSAQRRSIESAEKALQATEKSYQAGLRTIVEVLTAQQNLYQNQLDLNTARFDYLKASMRLKALAGMLTDNDITTLNQWLILPSN